MELWIGGRAQGKLSLALQKHQDAKVWDISEMDLNDKDGFFRFLEGAPKDGKIIWNHFHMFVKRALSQGMEPLKIWETVSGFVDKHPNLIIICDEIGNGIVPMEQEERRYREEAGRMLCKLAVKADSVERIFCGIPVKIK